MNQSIFKCVVALLLTASVSAKTLEEVKAEAEERVMKLAESISEAYNTRCSDEVAACSTKFYNGC